MRLLGGWRKQSAWFELRSLMRSMIQYKTSEHCTLRKKRKEIQRDLCARSHQFTRTQMSVKPSDVQECWMPSSCHNYASTASPGIINSLNNPRLLCDLRPATDIWLRHNTKVTLRHSQPRLGWRARWVPVVLEGPSDRAIPYLPVVRTDPADMNEHGEMSWIMNWL